MASQQGWAISQVEALIGLSRRDIQRCCYEGKGGVGILSPEDSKWGRRTYTADDLARLFIVARMKADGMSLPEARRTLDRAGQDGCTDDRLLKNLASRLTEELEQTESLLLSAQAILSKNDRTKLRKIIVEHLEKSADRRADAQEIIRRLESFDFAGLSEDARFFILDQLNLPGLALALELWLGPHTVERLTEKLDSSDTPNQPKEG